jgi:ribosomal protein S18 acetylase RimI-like enzyme
VDEVDVCSNQRRKGAGKAIMQKLIEIAYEKGCEEVWLGAEAQNMVANALYLSLKPDEVSQVIGYTFDTNE